MQHWHEIAPIDKYQVKASGVFHDLDLKILTKLYLPLIGAGSFSLYMSLWSEISSHTQWGEINTHYYLMDMLQSNLNQVLDNRIILEGIGLIETYIHQQSNEDERYYIYELKAPLSPKEFFTEGVLNIFLYNRVGANKYQKLKSLFLEEAIDHQVFFKKTRTFNEVFQTNLEQSSNQFKQRIVDSEAPVGLEYVGYNQTSGIQMDHSFDFDLLMSSLSNMLIPKKIVTKEVREIIEKLAFLYELDAISMKDVLLKSITYDDQIDIEKLRKSAQDWYQLETGKKLPDITSRTQPTNKKIETSGRLTKEERFMKQLENISPKQLLLELSGGVEPPVADMKIIEDVMLKQKLLPGVVNVLIHYVMLKTDMKLAKNYVEKIAGHWSRKQVQTVEQAMELAKKENVQYLEWAQSYKGKKRAPVRKELLPDWLKDNQQEQSQSSSKQDSPVEEATQDESSTESREKLMQRLAAYKQNRPN